MSQEQLNAQQVSQLQQQFERRVSAAVDSMGLRKWAVDLAYQYQMPGTKPVDEARAIYDFVTEAAR
jgi:hypothetical protein